MTIDPLSFVLFSFCLHTVVYNWIDLLFDYIEEKYYGEDV